MFSAVLISLVVIAALQQGPVTIVQKTNGWCSPAIANVVGNVTVNCIGVDPRALKRLNAELNRKNLELADKIREADEWTSRYKELECTSNLGFWESYVRYLWSVCDCRAAEFCSVFFVPEGNDFGSVSE